MRIEIMGVPFDNITLEEAMQKTVAYENMSYTAEQVFRVIGNCQK